SDSTRFLKSRLDLLIKQRDALASSTKAEGDNAVAQTEGRKAFEEYHKAREANFTKTQKMNKALEDEQRRITKARAAGYKISAEDETAAYKAIRDNPSYKDADPKKPKAYQEDAGTKALDSARQRYASQLANAKQGLDNNLAGAGLGDVQKQRLQEQRNIQQAYQAQMDKLTSDYNKSNKDQFSTKLYDKETASLKSALDQRLAIQQQHYVDVDKAQNDWTNGASAAYEDYLQSAKDVAGQTKNLFSNAFSGMEDALVSFAMTGKASFGDFAK
nr:hypothetical protein [Tanacetum cinerariifolium]